MPLETASTLNQLDANNPTVTDGISQGDDHLRLIKTAVKGSFPNFTGNPVASTEAQLDAGAAVAQTGAAKLADAGAFFNTNNTDGVTNPTAGEVDLKAGGNVVLQAKSDKSVTVAGALSAAGNASVGGTLASTGPITGPGAIPLGGTMVWWDDTLPDASFGTYAWANGQTVAKASVATELFTRWGNKFGGDGINTMGLPNLCEAVPVGKSTMGGATARGAISNFTSAVLNAINGLFGESKHTLVAAEAPTDQTFTTTVTDTRSWTVPCDEFGVGAAGGNPAMFDTGSSHSKPVAVSGSISAATSSNAGGQGHNNVQPSTVCNWIVRIA